MSYIPMCIVKTQECRYIFYRCNGKKIVYASQRLRLATLYLDDCEGELAVTESEEKHKEWQMFSKDN